MLQPGGLYKLHKLQNAATATGNGTPVVTTDVAAGAFATLTVQVTGINGDTITWEMTVDGSNWVAMPFKNLNSGAVATTATANGIYRAVVLGLSMVRARISTYSAGTITVLGLLATTPMDDAAIVSIGSIAAGNNNIGDVDVASLPALPAGTNAIGSVRDNGPHWASGAGVSGARFTSADQSGAAASITDAPTAGQKLVITDLIVSVGAAILVDFKEETSGTVLLSLYMAANSTEVVSLRSKLKLATADKKLQVQTSGAGSIAVTALYYSEA